MVPGPSPALRREDLADASYDGAMLSELSSYPARSVLKIERRTLPGESAQDLEERVSLGATELVARTLVEVATRFCR